MRIRPKTFATIAGAAILVATPLAVPILPGIFANGAAGPAAEGPLTALPGSGPWLNSPPLRPEDLRGKVVLVNVWTYSCINSLRTLPYLRAWAEKYKDRGLVVIGVHAPEFGFEKNVANVRSAVATLGVNYPVVLDSDFAIWRALRNRGWPGFYFIGADGRLRGQKLGEGNYDQSEKLLIQLLAEADGRTPAEAVTEVRGTGAQAAPDWADLESPETYVGYRQALNFVSPGGLVKGAPHLYRAPGALSRNQWALAGAWTVGSEFASLDRASGRITYRFHARDLHLVMAPATAGRALRFRIRIDGARPGSDHGVDVDADGVGTVRDARMYQLVRQAGPVTDRTFEIEFLDPGIHAYVFTFG